MPGRTKRRQDTQVGYRHEESNMNTQEERQVQYSFPQKSHAPLIELPPLSPGIQARVMEEVEVVETVRRGWSGGTEDKAQKL